MGVTIGAIIAGVVSIAAVVVRWWWTSRAQNKLDQRRQENEEISRHADAGDAGWFNRHLDDWMRQGDD